MSNSTIPQNSSFVAFKTDGEEEKIVGPPSVSHVLVRSLCQMDVIRSGGLEARRACMEVLGYALEVEQAGRRLARLAEGVLQNWGIGDGAEGVWW